MRTVGVIDYARLVRDIKDAVVVADEHGNILEVNRAAADLFGTPAADLVGRPLTQIMPERYRAAHEAGLARYLRTGVASLIGKAVQVEALHRDGREIPVELSLARLGDTDEPRFAAVIRDLTQVRRLEDAVATERGRAERLDEAVRLRDEFLALASHELRTPVSVLKLQARLAEKGPLDAEGVARLRRQVDRVERLVARMLDTMTLTAGPMATSPVTFDLGAVARQVALDFAVLAPDHPVHVHAPDAAIHVFADRPRIEDVLYNLLDNAVKYSPKPGPITVTVWMAEGDPPRAFCRVLDQGIGVPVTLRDRLFSRFTRERSDRVRSIAGLGVGLYICRGIVEAHGGRIDVQSDEGTGSAFTFDLPVAAEHPRRAAPGRVLVVDDDPDLLEMVRLTLQLASIPCEGARDGVEALEAMRAQTPVLVLLDLMMPGMDGWECVRRMRLDDQLRDVPVVLVSGHREVRSKAVELGVPHWLGKPVDVDQMLDLVRRYVPAA
jgi:PAS domain S-box-containing protein